MRSLRRPPLASLRRSLVGLAFIALFVFLFWPTVVWMAERFGTRDSFYSHGWLVPLASGWLIWRRRERWKHVPRRASFWGLALLVPSVLLHLLATWWKIHVVSGFAMVGALWGLIWTCWGWQALWTLRVPLLFLLFMVPLPSILLIALSFKMKLIAATLATSFLKGLGIPALQAGSTIHVPGASVVVDDTCSGLRSLISLLALAAWWTQLLPPTSARWQKLAIVAASVPIALVANWIRIVVLVLVSAIYGPALAEGFMHYGSGMVVFGFALLALAWLSRHLVRPSNATI